MKCSYIILIWKEVISLEKTINVKIDEAIYWELKKILITKKITMKEGVEKAITSYIKSVKEKTNPRIPKRD